MFVARSLKKKTTQTVLKYFKRFRKCKGKCPPPDDKSQVDKVTILGSANPLGQYLAFLLKGQEVIRNLALYDEKNVRGVALDLEHISTKCKVKGNTGEHGMKDALRVSKRFCLILLL